MYLRVINHIILHIVNKYVPEKKQQKNRDTSKIKKKNL
jgi:hypothetical protein